MAIWREFTYSMQWLVPVNVYRTCNGWLDFFVRVISLNENHLRMDVLMITLDVVIMLLVFLFFITYRDSPSSYRRKDSMGQSIVTSNHNRSESATIGKQNRYQTTTLTRFGDSLSHRNPYPVSSTAYAPKITFPLRCSATYYLFSFWHLFELNYYNCSIYRC